MFKQIKYGMTFSSLLYIVVGCCLVFWPGTSVKLCCYALGGLLLLSGISQIHKFLVRRADAFLLAYLNLIFGVICCAAALFLLLRPEVTISIFPIIFGLFVIFDSVGRFSSAMDLKKAQYIGWWKFLLLSVLSILLGVFMVCNPFGSITAMVTAVGVILLIEGFLNIFGLTYSSVMLYRFEKTAARIAEAERKALEVEQKAEDERPVAILDEDGPVIDVDYTEEKEN